LIDIGNNQTSYVVFEDGYALSYGVLPVGGEDVTKDISIGMQIDIKEAEQIKKEYGEVVSEEQKPHTTSEDPIDRYYLAEIISARYEQIFQRINKYLHKM
jgi:cell division protein FtsA